MELGIACAPRPTVAPCTRLDGAELSDGRPHTLARASVAARLLTAQAKAPRGVRLLVVEGLRPMDVQRAIHSGYLERLRAGHPHASEDRLHQLASRFVAPPANAPHVSGAAVDFTLVGRRGALDLGTEINATPEESNGACYTASRRVSQRARRNRASLGEALGAAGLVNYPTEWWHWSFGDRYWAYVVGAPRAVHGPVHAPSLAHR